MLRLTEIFSFLLEYRCGISAVQWVPIMFHRICRRICFTVIELLNVIFFSVNDDIRKISDISSEFVVEERFTPETLFLSKIEFSPDAILMVSLLQICVFPVGWAVVSSQVGGRIRHEQVCIYFNQIVSFTEKSAAYFFLSLWRYFGGKLKILRVEGVCAVLAWVFSNLEEFLET
jgi:hypothetical protein